MGFSASISIPRPCHSTSWGKVTRSSTRGPVVKNADEASADPSAAIRWVRSIIVSRHSCPTPPMARAPSRMTRDGSTPSLVARRLTSEIKLDRCSRGISTSENWAASNIGWTCRQELSATVLANPMNAPASRPSCGNRSAPLSSASPAMSYERCETSSKNSAKRRSSSNDSDSRSCGVASNSLHARADDFQVPR